MVTALFRFYFHRQSQMKIETEKETMRIFINAKPNAREEKVEKLNDAEFIVSVKEPPVQGRANAAIVSAIARHFRIRTSQIRIVSGHTARRKIVEITDAL